MERAQYPSLRDNPGIIHLDASAAFPIHDLVAESVHRVITSFTGSPGKADYGWSRQAEGEVQVARAAIASLIGASPDEIFFTRSASDSAYWLHKTIAPLYDHAIYSAEDHTSTTHLFDVSDDVVPLSYAQNGLYDTRVLDEYQQRRCFAFVSMAHHLYGCDNDMIGMRRLLPRSFIAVDASQSVGRIPIDVKKLECDALYFSSQKIGGIAGAGILYIASSHHMAARRQAIEPSTLPLPAIASMTPAVSVLQSQDVARIDLQLTRQSGLLIQCLSDSTSGISFSKGMAFSDYRCRGVGIVSFKVAGYTSQDVGMILDDAGINVRAADHCVDEDAVDRDVVRVSMHAYTTDEDIRVLTSVLSSL